MKNLCEPAMQANQKDKEARALAEQVELLGGQVANLQVSLDQANELIRQGAPETQQVLSS